MEAASQILSKFVDLIVNPILLLIFSVGFLIFIWGLVTFLFRLKDGGEQSEGKRHMLWGLIGMLVMLSAYAIVNFLLDSFNLRTSATDVSRLERAVKPIRFINN